MFKCFDKNRSKDILDLNSPIFLLTFTIVAHHPVRSAIASKSCL